MWTPRIEKVDRSVQRDEKESKNFLTITIYLSEGEQWTYGGMTFEGNEIFPSDKLASLIRQPPGKIINKTRLEAGHANGWPTCTMKTDTFQCGESEEKRDDRKKEISFTIHILERDRGHIESIILKGHTKTKDYVIFRELPFEEGDVFSRPR